MKLDHEAFTRQPAQRIKSARTHTNSYALLQMTKSLSKRLADEDSSFFGPDQQT